MNEDKKFSVDVKQFAQMFGVEDSTAYGVLRFFAEKGIVETTKRQQPIVDGVRKKGKPATIFLIEVRGTVARLGALLTEGFEKVKDKPEFQIAPPVAVQAPVQVQVQAVAETPAAATEPVTTDEAATLVETADGVLVQTVDTSAGVVIG